jgi:undecaprenyl-diphosphatase
MGLVQAFAIIPGISRSGSTIVVGLRRGLSAEAAASFSFLLSIPAILGALVLKLPDLEEEQSLTGTEMVLSLAVSFSVGLAALGLLVWLTRRRRLWVFAPYCWAVGVIALLATFLA